MTQTSNRFFDEIGRLMNDAAGAAQGVKREVDTVVRNQAEKILSDLDIVKREEFEAVKDMARLAREENEALKARIAVLEAKLGDFGARRRRPAAEDGWAGQERRLVACVSCPDLIRASINLHRRLGEGMAGRVRPGPDEGGDRGQENPRISLSFRRFGARTPPRPQPPHPWRLAAAATGPRCGL